MYCILQNSEATKKIQEILTKNQSIGPFLRETDRTLLEQNIKDTIRCGIILFSQLNGDIIDL